MAISPQCGEQRRFANLAAFTAAFTPAVLPRLSRSGLQNHISAGPVGMPPLRWSKLATR